MGRRDTLEADVFQPLWAAGWQWVWIVAGGLFLGGYLILEFGDVLQGGGVIAGSSALAALGIWYVNTNAESVLQSGIEMGQSAVLDIAGVGDGDAVSSIPTEGRGLALVDPAREYHLTTLVVGDEAFVVHDDTTVSLAHRYYAVGDDTRVYEYETLESVTFDDGELTLALRDGSTESYTLAREPTDVVSALRTRLPAVEHRE